MFPGSWTVKLTFWVIFDECWSRKCSVNFHCQRTAIFVPKPSWTGCDVDTYHSKMNIQLQPLTIHVSATITVRPEQVETILQQLGFKAFSGRPDNLPKSVAPAWGSKREKINLLINETAKLLGVYATVYGLLYRGLLKGSSAFRHKLIPFKEIERFLKETMK